MVVAAFDGRRRAFERMLPRFIYYRWLLHVKIKDEHVEYKDSWHFAAERVLLGLSVSTGSPTVRVSEYAHKWQLPQAGEQLGFKARVTCPVVRDVQGRTCASSPPALSAAVPLA
mmetsp:Transcript_22894/g.40752  ORF Transcript_22894/g.40752 Transcript_22894/m.40752 type:complete len:114 (-) Transcript_22894:596-937(-)